MIFLMNLNLKPVRSRMLLVIYFVFSFTGSLTHADEIVVNKVDQLSLDAFMARLNISHDDMKKSSKRRDDKFSKYLDIKDRYYYKDESRKDFWFVTDADNRILALKISWTDLDDLNEVKKFTHIKSLAINSNKFKDLEGISLLKRLMFLNLIGNDFLKDIGGIHNLPELIEIKANTLKNISIMNMKNLPKLESFLCGLCIVDDINPLADFRNLKILKLGMIQKTINPFRSLSKIEFLDINGDNLIDVSAVNSMKELKSLNMRRINIEELKLDRSLINIEKIIIGDSKLKALPDVSGFNNLKELTVYGSDISDVNTVHDMNKLEVLSLVRNLNMKKVTNLKNLPNLKELEMNLSPLEEYETGDLPSLEELNLSKTNITKLSGFENFPNLRRLILNETKVKSLKGIEKAPSLHWVQTDYEVKQDPENIKVLRQLRENRYKR